jgi:Bifunctional DNA primase/polymerase, N-terminal
MPDSNIGVVLDDVLVVVIDVDGPGGRASLDWLLAQAGLDGLPDTYTVTTGRLDGGKHYWFRLPPGAVKLVNQVGHHLTPHLDVLFQGHAVGAGSVHKSGAPYRGNISVMPEPSALTELPVAVYEVLAHRGRPKVAGSSRSPRRARPTALVKARTGATTAAINQSGLPQHVKVLLADRSDGRNDRTFKAVISLVRLGLDDQEIVDIVLAAPLGARAYEERNPQSWLQDKIDAAHRYRPPVLDREAFWIAVHTSGMTSSQIRLLDALLCRASDTGFVCMSQAWMGIGSAITSPADVVHTLVEKGWLTVLRPGSVDHPTSYRLSIPDMEADEKSHLKVCPPPFSLPSPSQCGLWVRFLVHHDAFRCKQGSLHPAYPLLTLLRPEPQGMDTLAGWLGGTPRALRDRAKSLVKAGLAVQDADGLSLTSDPVLPLLDAVAVKVGTDGDRLRAIELYFARIAQWRLARAEAGEVGSPTWRKCCRARLMAKLAEGDFATMVEHLDGDVEAVATFLVDQEALMLSPDPETRINGLAVLAADLRGRAR